MLAQGKDSELECCCSARIPKSLLILLNTEALLEPLTKPCQIFFNNNAYTCATATTLYDFLVQQGYEARRGIAVAVNDSVIPKDSWKETVLPDGSTILVITATQGG